VKVVSGFPAADCAVGRSLTAACLVDDDAAEIFVEILAVFPHMLENRRGEEMDQSLVLQSVGHAASEALRPGRVLYY
jgi:hypothetical protein